MALTSITSTHTSVHGPSRPLKPGLSFSPTLVSAVALLLSRHSQRHSLGFPWTLLIQPCTLTSHLDSFLGVHCNDTVALPSARPQLIHRALRAFLLPFLLSLAQGLGGEKGRAGEVCGCQ